jgi:hypothetical protein
MICYADFGIGTILVTFRLWLELSRLVITRDAKVRQHGWLR